MPIQKVTSGIIADGAIVATDIADGIVTNAKLAGSITGNKIATGQITGNLLTANCVSGNNIVSSPTITGNVTINGSLGIGGATPASSGYGITFPGTQVASSDANTLDDYEEGTWTPSIGGNATYGGRYGRYVKVGKMVTVQFLININSIGTGSTGNVSGLPFTSEGIGNVQTGSVSFFADILNARYWLGFYVENNATTFQFVSTTGSVNTVDNGTAVFKNSTTIYGSATYMT